MLSAGGRVPDHSAELMFSGFNTSGAAAAGENGSARNANAATKAIQRAKSTRSLLVALKNSKPRITRLAFQKGTCAVHFGAAAPGAAELTVDEYCDTAIAARWREFVGRDQRVDGGRDEGRFERRQGDEGFRILRHRHRRLRRRRLLLRLDRLGEPRRNRRTRAACAEQESAAWDSIVRHGILPHFCPQAQRKRRAIPPAISACRWHYALRIEKTGAFALAPVQLGRDVSSGL